MSAIFSNLLHTLAGAALGAVAVNPHPTGAAGNAHHALEQLGAAVGPAALRMFALGGAATATAAALHTGWKELKAFSLETLHAREGLRQFNGVIAIAYAKLDLLTLQQQFAMGSATSVSTEMMVESRMQMLRAQQPSQQLGANLSNILSSAVNEMSADITNAITAASVSLPAMIAGAIQGIPGLGNLSQKLQEMTDKGVQAIRDAQLAKTAQTPWGSAIIERGRAYEGPNMPPLGGR